MQADRLENQPRNTSKVEADAKSLQEVSDILLHPKHKLPLNCLYTLEESIIIYRIDRTKMLISHSEVDERTGDEC